MQEKIEITLSPGATKPAYARPGDAGADLCAIESVVIAPGQRVLIGTGVSIALPPGYVGLVTPRSGAAWKFGLSIVNSPGIIDSGYRGEIKINLVNLDQDNEIRVEVGDRIAQLVVVSFASADFVTVDELDSTVRGTAGHGSTGGIS